MQLEDRFFTSTEVAEILGVSLRSVYRYLEEGKIDAEIKTATGRHRFTRQNILNFLYPDGAQADDSKSTQSNFSNVNSSMSQSSFNTRITQPRREPIMSNTQQAPAAVITPTTAPNTSNQVSEKVSPVDVDVEVEVEVEEEVDWLSKFRAAAQKHREQMQSDASKSAIPQNPITPPTPAVTPPQAPIAQEVARPVVENPQERVHIDSLSSLTEEKPNTGESVYYYTSGVGGLKELAQYINKATKKAGVPYAFTMNAGLSLHKLIRPFSLLHIYIKSEDRSFFEKTLELSPVDKSSAQLALFIDRGSILKSVNEVHGLSVVSNEQLKKDLLNAGEDDLARELNDLA